VSLHASARPPTPATPPVRPEQKAAVRALLEEHRLARRDQVKALTLAYSHDSDLDPGARLRALAAADLTLGEIDLALLRLDDGSYGFCARCTQPIPAERLLAVPYARHCAPCA
jgi:DnaK suppressor protein